MHRHVNPGKFFIFLFICFPFYWYTNSLSAQKVTLLFAGDAMQHQSQLDNAYRNGKYDYSSYFRYVTDEISKADIAVVNLEVTLGGIPFKGYPMFSAPDEYAIALKEAGFDIFLTANNHCLDRHSNGLERTIRILDSLQVKHTGTFRNASERKKYYPLMFTRNGIRMAFLNYTYGTNGMEVKAPNVVNYIEKEQIKKDIKDARDLDADFIIVNIHWGDEYKLTPNKEQEKLADFLVEQGVDLIIGCHPHVVQPSKVLKDFSGNISHVIVYSLGNFISGMRAANTTGGQMIKIELSKEVVYRPRINSCSYSLVHVYKPTQNGKIDYTLLPVNYVEKRENDPLYFPPVKVEEDAYNQIITFTRTSRELFSEHNIGVEEYWLTKPDSQ